MRNKYFKRIASGIVAVSMLISSTNIAFAMEGMAVVTTEKEVVSTLQDDIISTPEMGKTGYVDAGIEYGRIPDYSLDSVGYDKAEVIPEAYDSRVYGHVTAVRNQNPWGTCWAHAAVAAMESYALSHGLVSKPEDINLSEFALAYLTFEDENMLLDKTGDYTDTTDAYVGFDAGGNDEMAYKALSNGLGLYDDDETQYTQSQYNQTVPKIEWDEDNISYVLTGQKFIDMEDMDQVKKAVMENGAVTTSYYSHKNYINGNYLYNYNYELSSTNHAVVIVGWDDKKAKENFTVSDGTTTHTPKNDGAWLIKNSWGTSIGESGYIWISYEDMGILSSDAVYYEIAPKSKYPVLYQHDGATVAYNFTYGYSFASVFEVEGKKEKVNAVSFHIYSTQMGYTAYLYDNSNGKELDEGDLIATKSGITTYAGYYTVDFDTDYVFMEGDKFTVIIEFASQTAMAYAPNTINYAGVGNTYSTCQSGQSYIIKSSIKGYEDVVDSNTYMNISLKAHSMPVTDKSTPTQIKEVKVIGDKQVSLQWKPIEDAVSYELWKSTSENGSEYKIITGITDVTYIDSEVSGSSDPTDLIRFGETYYYKVRAVYSDGTYNDYSNVKKVEIVPTSTTTNVTVSKNKLNISWDKLDYADGYNIYIGSVAEENIEKVGEVAGNITSYIYDKRLNYYTDYYVAVEPYVYNSQGTKICGSYEVLKISTKIKQAEMVDAHYIVEDSIYLEWDCVDGNLADGIYIEIICNGMTAGREMIETSGTSYILDVSRFEVGDFLQIKCSIYYEIDDGSYGINSFYSDYFEIGATFEDDVFWYVKDNQIYVCMPNADAPKYEIYYGYDETKVGFSDFIEVTQEQMKTGYPLPAASCPITGCSIGVRMTPDVYNQVIPKNLIKIGGTFDAPQIQAIPNVRVSSSGAGVKLKAIIENEMEGFNYEYQWYVSDFKNGTATPISGATNAEYTAYVGEAEAKYYYCQITCKYNGEQVYTTVNEKGERTRVLGKNCFDNVTILDIQGQNYTGSAVKPSVTVMEDDTKLVLGTHYKVTYENNINAGRASVKITFLGSYAALGTKVKEFEITPVSISGTTIGDISDQIYTGTGIEPQLSIKNGAIALIKDTDYTVEYSANIELGIATVVIKGVGNYTGTITKNFNIVKVPSSKLAVANISAQTYTGQELSPEVIVMYGSYTLVKGTDYELAYSNNTKVGTATVTITLKGNYSGVLTKTFAIVGKPIASVTISEVDDYMYTGLAITPTVTVMDGSKVLVLGVDYTISYNDNINAGTAKINVIGKGNYAGTQVKNFTIVPISCEGFVVSNINNHTYSGSYITPLVTVKNGSVNLVNGTDYTVSYGNNLNAGTANVSIVFKGNYKGTLGASFEIKPKSIENINIGAISEQMYTGGALTPAVAAKDGSYTLVNNKDYTLSYTNNINSGVATITLTGKGNYTGTKKTTFTIKSVPEKITSSTVSVADKSSSISKITSGTTVGTLVAKLNESKYVAVYKGSTKVENNALVGTGMTACIMDGNKITKKYTVIITGDTSGDGKINITDMIAVKAHILKKTILSGAYSKAGDVSGDAKINITDFIKIKATLLGKDSISGVAVD